MDHTFRITPEKAYRLVRDGDALLVCADDDAQQCAENKPRYAVARDIFDKHRDRIPRSKEIIFYCDCPNDATSAGLAKSYQAKGFNVSVLKGGARAWKRAGYPLSGSSGLPPDRSGGFSALVRRAGGF